MENNDRELGILDQETAPDMVESIEGISHGVYVPALETEITLLPPKEREVGLIDGVIPL